MQVDGGQKLSKLVNQTLYVQNTTQFSLPANDMWERPKAAFPLLTLNNSTLTSFEKSTGQCTMIAWAKF